MTAIRQRLDAAAELVATYGLAAYIVTLPLEFSAVYMGQQLSRFVLVVVAVAFAYLLIRRRRRLTAPRYPSVYLLVALLVASLASWLATRAPGSSSSLADIALYPVVALLITNLLLTEKDHRRAWFAFLVAGFGVALLGAFLYLAHLQIWTPNPQVANRMNITFGDPNITARFLTLVACAAVIVYSARQAPAWLAIAAAVACAVVTPLTFSRSGLALFMLCMVVATVVALNHRRAAALGVTALVLFALSTAVNPDTRLRAEDAAYTLASAIPGAAFAQHAPADAATHHHQAAVVSDDNRRYLIAAGLKMGVDHPIVGVGFGGFQHALLTTYDRFLPAVYTDSVSHTSAVTVFAEQGIVGLILMLAFLIQLAREALAVRSRHGPWSLWTAVAATLVIPIFLYSQFEGRFLQEPYLWLALGMMYSAMMSADRAVETASERDRARFTRVAAA